MTLPSDIVISGLEITSTIGQKTECYESDQKVVSIFSRYVKFFKSLRMLSDRKKFSHVIRNARFSDLNELKRIEEQCWSKSRRTEKTVLQARLEVYPEGQFVIELNGGGGGVLYSQRIKSRDELFKMRQDTSWDFCDKTGAVVQLLGVNILPQYQGYGFGDELLKHLLDHSKKIKDATSFVAVSFCKNYHKQTEQKFEEYIRSKDKHGFVKNPILRFHERHGGQVSGVLKGYRPDDHENEGNGVLIVFNIFSQKKPSEEKIEIKKIYSQDKEKKFQQKQEEECAITSTLFLEQLVKTHLAADKEISYSEKIPLMEMGLDSADLLSVRDQLNSHYQLNLESIFFFEYNTIGKIKKYLKEQYKS